MHYPIRLFFSVLLLCHSLAHAQSPEALSLSTSRFEKLQAVLEHLGAPDSRSFYDDLTIWDGAQTRNGFETILKYVDPKGVLKRYSTWDNDKFILFQDRDEKKVVDFSLAFQPGGIPADRTGLLRALKAAAKNPTWQPLAGLRVALDPGHMGGPFWDYITGKVVQANGRKVSEGVIALQVCLLLSRELKNLGAEVMLTRYVLDAVSPLPYKTFDLSPFAADEIRQSVDKPWFERLLNAAPLSQKLLALFDQNPNIKGLRSEEQRDHYFIHRADLSARAQKIDAFQPHLTIFVHFDGDRRDRTQTSVIETRAYVPGNILPDEFSSRQQRAEAVRLLFDGHRWMESYVFSAAITKGISDATRINLKSSPQDIGAIKISNGVYARNLALNHLVSQGVMAFLEVLNYDYDPEHRRLATIDRHTSIETPVGNVKLDYSSRIDDIVDGMKRGILDYVTSR